MPVAQLFGRYGHTQIERVDTRHAGIPVATVVATGILLPLFIGLTLAVLH